MTDTSSNELNSALALLRERTEKEGADALAQSLKAPTNEGKLAAWSGFVAEVFTGIPGLSKVVPEVLAQSSWFGMQRALDELDEELLEVARRDELLELFDAQVAEQHGETVRAVGTMLANHRDELNALIEEVFLAQLSKLAYDDRDYRQSLGEEIEKTFNRLYFKMELSHQEMFDRMDELTAASGEAMLVMDHSVFRGFARAVVLDPGASLTQRVSIQHATFEGDAVGLHVKGDDNAGKP